MREGIKLGLLLAIAAALSGLLGEVRGIHHDLTMANCLSMAADGIKCKEAQP